MVSPTQAVQPSMRGTFRGCKPWPSSDEPFLMLIRTAYKAICERLDFVDQDDDFEPLALSNAADELASLISVLEMRREALLS